VSRTKTRQGLTTLQVITPLDRVRDFGVTTDGELLMDQHVRNVVRDGYMLLPAVATSKCMAVHDNQRSTYRTLAVAFVATRVDYCNAVLYGVTQVTRRHQMLLNAAAHLVVGTGKFDHLTPGPLLCPPLSPLAACALTNMPTIQGITYCF